MGTVNFDINRVAIKSQEKKVAYGAGSGKFETIRTVNAGIQDRINRLKNSTNAISSTHNRDSQTYLLCNEEKSGEVLAREGEQHKQPLSKKFTDRMKSLADNYLEYESAEKNELFVLKSELPTQKKSGEAVVVENVLSEGGKNTSLASRCTAGNSLRSRMNARAEELHSALKNEKSYKNISRGEYLLNDEEKDVGLKEINNKIKLKKIPGDNELSEAAENGKKITIKELRDFIDGGYEGFDEISEVAKDDVEITRKELHYAVELLEENNAAGDCGVIESDFDKLYAVGKIGIHPVEQHSAKEVESFLAEDNYFLNEDEVFDKIKYLDFLEEENDAVVKNYPDCWSASVENVDEAIKNTITDFFSDKEVEIDSSELYSAEESVLLMSDKHLKRINYKIKAQHLSGNDAINEFAHLKKEIIEADDLSEFERLEAEMQASDELVEFNKIQNKTYMNARGPVNTFL